MSRSQTYLQSGITVFISSEAVQHHIHRTNKTRQIIYLHVSAVKRRAHPLPATIILLAQCVVKISTFQGHSAGWPIGGAIIPYVSSLLHCTLLWLIPKRNNELISEVLLIENKCSVAKACEESELSSYSNITRHNKECSAVQDQLKVGHAWVWLVQASTGIITCLWDSWLIMCTRRLLKFYPFASRCI